MKKTDDLSIEKTFAFARQCYADKQNHAGENLLNHCKQVARQAEIIAQKLYQDLRVDYVPENTNDIITAIVHCGLLHDVLNVSACAFENVAEIANVQIAAMVAALSRDYRLVETKRDMEFRGRLSQSAISTQIVALANILCTAKEVLKSLDVTGLAGVSKSKKILAQLDGDLLAVQAAHKYHVLTLYAHTAKNLLGDISQKIKTCRQRAKMEKLIMQNTKTLRESVEAAKKTKDVTKEKKVAAKKNPEVRYARKRNLRPDSE